MGDTRCHFKSIFSPAATLWQIVLHSNVVAHQRQLCQEARYWQEATDFYSRCDARRAKRLGCWRLQRGRLAVKPISVIFVLLKKLLQTQIYRCLSAPHSCGPWGSARYRQTFAGFSSPQTPMNAGKYVSMVHFPLTTKLWAFASRIKAATMKCGYTCISLTITAAMNRAKNTNNGLLKGMSALH